MDFYENKAPKVRKKTFVDEDHFAIDKEFVNIEVNKIPNKMQEHIPCLYLPYDDPSSKILIYFHANAEDIGVAYDLLLLIGEQLKVHVLAVEYPGYGLYKSSPPDEHKMKQDAVIVYDYLTTVAGI